MLIHFEVEFDGFCSFDMNYGGKLNGSGRGRNQSNFFYWILRKKCINSRQFINECHGTIDDNNNIDKSDNELAPQLCGAFGNELAFFFVF